MKIKYKKQSLENLKKVGTIIEEEKEGEKQDRLEKEKAEADLLQIQKAMDAVEGERDDAVHDAIMNTIEQLRREALLGTNDCSRALSRIPVRLGHKWNMEDGNDPWQEIDEHGNIPEDITRGRRDD